MTPPRSTVYRGVKWMYGISLALSTTALTGCIGLFGAMFVQPGSTVEVITASSSQVYLEYTHSYDSELPAAGRIAEEKCGAFGRHAEFVSSTPKNLDRSYATFRCVA